MTTIIETTDADFTTSYTLASGDNFVGTMDGSDSYEMISATLIAGQVYTLVLTGLPPDVTLLFGAYPEGGGSWQALLEYYGATPFSSYGTITTYSRDPVTGVLSMSFTAQTTGTYKVLLDVQGLTSLTSYDLALDPPPPTGPTEGDDTLLGTTGDDVVYLLAGNDTYDAGDGNDTVYGGSGNDTITGGLGDDQLSGGDGDDTLIGDDGNDFLSGGAGNDVLRGGLGNDDIRGMEDDDLIYGGGGDDKIDGGSGNDEIYGNTGNDTIYALHGDDVVDGGAGNDRIAGGQGNDTLEGGGGNDTIWGNDGDDLVSGGAGNDWVLGGDGNDIIIGGTGDDTLNGHGGADVFVFATGSGHDWLRDFEDGADLLDVSGQGVAGMGDMTLTQAGSWATVTFASGDILSIRNTDISELDASDFIFADPLVS